MAGNIIGEPISPIIGEQVKLRQQIHGSGYNENSISRSPEVLNFLNNKNAWIKLASGVSLDNSQRLKDLAKFETSKYFTESDYASLVGSQLAKNYILFNSMQGLTQGAEQQGESGGVTTQTRAAIYSTRRGVRSTNSWNGSNDKMYGGMGGNSRGLQPVPGITNIYVESINRGSIRKATVTLKAFNKFQFGIIEILYLRLGYLMMLEWGWDKYIDSIDKNNKPIIKNLESTIIENEWFNNQDTSQLDMLQVIDSYVKRYKGNYQGFFGKVNNFSWTLNSDNTYDITINLISLGSVIESLQVIVPTNPISPTEMEKRTKALRKIYQIESSDETNSVITNLGSDRLSQYIAQTIETFFDQKLENNKDFCLLPNLVSTYSKDTKLPDIEKNKSKIPIPSQYYIRFEKLLEVIEDNVIFRIVNGTDSKNVESAIKLKSYNEFTRINYYPNLVPLDPSIAVFKPVFTSEFGITENINVPSMDGLQDFVVENDGVYYGKLMNVYLNLDWVSRTLSSNKNEKNELDLFNFLQKLLGGINRCMGETTSLTTSIKNDKEIYFLDENPIPGYDIVYPSQREEVEFNIIGYTPNSGSSFVTDFNFQTKITPKLMTQISIGATSPGSQTNSLDAVGYKNWNKGLTNRYEEKYENGPLSKYSTQTSEKSDIEKEAYYSLQYEKFKKEAMFVLYPGYYQWTYKNYTRKYSGTENSKLFESRQTAFNDTVMIRNVYAGIREIDEINAKEGNEFANEGEKLDGYMGYLLDGFGGVGSKKIEIPLSNTEKRKKAKENSRKGLPTDEGEGLKTKLVLQEVRLENALYWYTSDNSDFIERGYNTFKSYKSRLDQYQFDEKNITTGATGFIPVTLGLTFEGLGGIQIYNKLKVNQKALPASYPSSLKFIVDGLNHSVSDNKWVTNLTTISQPKTSKPIKLKIVQPQVIEEKTQVIKEWGGDPALARTFINSYLLTSKTSNGLIYYPEETEKTQIVLHHTAVNAPIKNVIGKEMDTGWRGRTDHVATHFIIQRDGSYDQLFDLKYWANHLGTQRSGTAKAQRRTISIELESLGYLDLLVKDNAKLINPRFDKNSKFIQNGKEFTYDKLTQSQSDIPVVKPHKINSSNIIVEASPYRGYNFYQSYTKKQLETLKTVLEKIHELYPKIPIGSTYGGEKGNRFSNQFPDINNISKGAFGGVPGIYTHNSYRTNKIDVFPQKELLELLQEFN
tara:strand:- start:1598 stop:5218 length:3621 start_codon:yes stop_codon:yes gene_type:complete